MGWVVSLSSRSLVFRFDLFSFGGIFFVCLFVCFWSGNPKSKTRSLKSLEENQLRQPTCPSEWWPSKEDKSRQPILKPGQPS